MTIHLYKVIKVEYKTNQKEVLASGVGAMKAIQIKDKARLLDRVRNHGYYVESI